MSYDVFISHPQEDQAIAERFCKAFDKAGITYFCDCQCWDNDFKSHLCRISNNDAKLFNDFLEPAIKDSEIFLLLANETTFKKPLLNSLLLNARNHNERIRMALILTDSTEVSYDVECFFGQITHEIPEEGILINDVLFQLGRPLVFPEVDTQNYTRQELDEIIKKGDKYQEEHKSQKAFEMYHIAAACNVAEAQYKLGCGKFSYWYNNELLSYYNDLQPYYNELIEAAANQGYADALYKLGSIGYYGHGNSATWYKKAAEKGHIEGQRELADLYVSENPSIAEYWYERASTQGDLEAQVRLAELYSKEDDGLCDMEKSIYWYKKAAEHGRAEKYMLSIKAHLTLGIMYAKGIGCERNENEALHWFSLAVENHEAWEIRSFLHRSFKYDSFLIEQSRIEDIIQWFFMVANRGNKTVQFKLGLLFYWKHVYWRHAFNNEYPNAYFEEIVRWFEMLSREGNAESQYYLGLFYEDGIFENHSVVVEINDKLAAHWYRKSAEQGYAESQWRLGIMYACGKGVKKNDVKAAKWYRKAAMNGHKEAQNELATLYFNGDGVKCNYSKAEHWYLEAAKRGMPDAQNYLAESYRQWHFGIDRTNKAIRWYRLAAENGNTDAQIWLAVNYKSGTYVVRSEEQAMYWYRKAAEAGNALAQRNLAMMIAKGKVSRRKRAEALEWLQKAANQGDKVAIKELQRFIN